MSKMSTTTITEIRERIFRTPLNSLHAFFTINLTGGTRAPDDFANGDKFILDNTTWLQLQLYVQAGRKLPTDNVTLKVTFGDRIEEALGTATTKVILLSCFIY
jgi:hypothetical protein